eukprot:GILJ01006308.1.p1 GENE.GILJ01006308.1~~GILJ01006308.1.p1  ORF type:complete len:706 (-),score=87.80 GILJ01006308.1:258-2375(-)
MSFIGDHHSDSNVQVAVNLFATDVKPLHKELEVVTKKPYREVERQAIELLNSPALKKHTVKALAALRELSLYACVSSTSLIQALLHACAQEDHKLVRTALYMVGQLLNREDKEMCKLFIHAVEKDIDNTFVLRRVQALRARMSVVPSTSSEEESISRTLRDLLERVKLRSDTDPKKKKSKEKQDDWEKVQLRSAVFSAIRRRPEVCDGALEAILAALRAQETMTVMHACNVVVSLLSKLPPQKVATMLPTITIHISSSMRVNREDATALQELHRLLGFLLSYCLPHLDDTDVTEALQALVANLSHESLRVVLSAVRPFIFLPWRVLELMKCNDGSPVLDLITKKLSSCLLGERPTPELHAVSNVLAQLSRNFWLSTVNNGANQYDIADRTSPLRSLLSLVKSLVVHPSSFVRVQACVAFIWMLNTQDSTELNWATRALLKQFSVETVPRGIWGKSVLQQLLIELDLRMTTCQDGRLVQLLMDTCFKYYSTHLERLNANVMIQCLTHAASTQPREMSRQHVLRCVFQMLDLQPSMARENSSVLQSWLGFRRDLFMFLGNSCELLLGQETSLESISFVAPVLLRLESGATFEAWSTRDICIQSMARIAFLVGGAAKMQVPQFLRGLSVDPLNQSMVASTVLATLQQLSEANDRFRVLLVENAPDVAERVQHLHRELVRATSVVCLLPPDFCPLGPESRRFLVSDNPQ